MTDQPFFLTPNKGFKTASSADDFLHPAQNEGVIGDSLSETQYLGFNIPEHNIHALGYMWHHVNLGVVTGGLMAFQGVNIYPGSAHLFDMRTFHSNSVLKDDLHSYRLENSYSVSVIEPMKKLHMTYSDEARNNYADIEYTAVTPAVMFGDGKHFEQGMRVWGKLVLRGQEYEVDGFNVRDRSWGKLRPESLMPVPPISWMTGWFGESLFFNCTLFDHAGSGPQATGAFAMPVERALNSGWVARDGKISQIVKASKKLKRDPATLLPMSMELSITDETGEEMKISGKLLSSCPWTTWHNAQAHISLMRWEMNGRVGHGDSQCVIWNDYGHAWQGKDI